MAKKDKEKDWCEIIISGRKVKIDQSDLEFVQSRRWRVTESTTGRLRVVTSVRTPEGVRSITLGKFLLNPPDGKQVYPRRFNQGLDYRRDNLVVCTVGERQRLLPKRKVETTSKYRGVSYQKASGKWRAGIQIKGKTLNLGEFSSEHEAALAYNEAARQYFGDVAYQNSVGRKLTDRD
jgi:AP2-like factor (euAP2 lineage)